MSDKEGKLPTFAQISDATVKVGAMQFGEILRLRSDLAAANAIIADQKQQLQRLHITGAAAGLVNANHTLIKERDQLREQLQELHAAGGAAGEYRQLAADHKLAMVGIEKLRVSYDAAVAENRKLQEICEKERQERARLREKLHALEAHGGHEQAPADGDGEREVLRCPSCEQLPMIVGDHRGWRATCKCRTEAVARQDSVGRAALVSNWNRYSASRRSAANWPTVDGNGKPLERVGDGYYYAHGNGDVSALVGEAVQPAPFVGPRECPQHGKWGCMCPREPEPKGPAVRRGTGRSPKVEM